MNSFSDSAVFTDANKVYAGGIVGYNQYATIQNTYSLNILDSVCGIFDDSPGYTAGICGFSEGGFISDSVVLNSSIKTNGYVDKVCNSQSEMVSCVNNYIIEDMKVTGYEISCENGAYISKEEVNEKEFFFRPVMDGGKLGWIEGDVWYMNGSFPYPVLSGVKNQNEL